MSFSSEAINLIEYIASKFGVAIDWSNENILPMVQNLAGKYITWEIFLSIAWIVMVMILEIILIVIIRNDIKYWGTGAIVLFGSIGAIGLLSVVVLQIFDIIRCITFPELQIIQYLQNIARTMK